MTDATRRSGRWWLMPLAALLVLWLPALAAAEDLTAKITAVDGTSVTVRLEGKAQPKVGDKANIGFEVAGVGLIPLKGTWHVRTVSGSTATLVAEGNADQPRVGQIATITATSAAVLTRPNNSDRADNPPPKTRPSQAPEVLKADIRYIQQRLNTLGYNAGAADGLMGSRTRTAIRAFQRDRKMQVDGRATPILLMAVQATEGTAPANHPTPTAKPKETLLGTPIGEDPRSSREISQEAKNYYFGKNGKPQDYEKSYALNQILERRNYADGLYSLGVAHAFGNGAPKDFVVARGYFERAAAQDHSRALFNLAVIYEKGLGTTKDGARAINYMKRAVAAGQLEAHHALGVYYENGIGTRQDMRQAISWYRKGAKKGCEKAQKKLTEMGLKW